MAKTKIIAYALVLSAMILLGCVSLAAGDTTAHYENSDSWYLLLEPVTAPGADSNCLVVGGQTVLLGSMELERLQIPFTLSGIGTLSWKTGEGEYLLVELVIDGVSYTEAVAVDGQTEPKTVTLQLTPTQTALETVHDAIPVSVEVIWTTETEVLSGTFRTTLAALTELPTEPTEPKETEPEETEPEETEPEETEPEETEPEETEPEETEPEETEPEETEPEETEPEETEPEETEPEETKPTEPVSPLTEEDTEPSEEPTEPSEEPTEPSEEPTEPSEEPTEPSEEPTEPSQEPTEPSQEPTEPSQEPTEPSEEPTEPSEEPTEPSEEPTEPTEPTEPEEPASQIAISAPAAFCPEQGLPIAITFPEGTDRLQLKRTDEQGTAVEFAPFTRYSLDGTNWFLLYYGGSIDMTPAQDQIRQTLLLDLTLTQLPQQLTLYAQGFDGETSLGTAQAVTEGSILTLSYEEPFLSQKQKLTLQLPQPWREYTMTYTLTRRIQTEEGVTYEAVEFSPTTVTATHTVGDDEAPVNTLILSTGKPEEPDVLEKVLPAGTYRVEIAWTFEDICLAQQQMTFFIMYSSD